MESVNNLEVDYELIKPNIMKHYHNTTNQSKKFVKVESRKCKNQEEQVMVIMRARKQLTASDTWNVFCAVYKDVPLTSIRRALSNLSEDKNLVKKEKTKIGIYGKPEHYYALPFKKNN